MKFRNNLPSAEEVKNTDMVDYLSTLGFKPAKVTSNDYWYLSPFRQETIPSFKVNRNMNRWYDFGDGKGGNIIDFGILYYNCSAKELLVKFNKSLSFQQQNIQPNKEDGQEKKNKVITEKKISFFVLISYLHKRRIQVDIVNKFCKEIDYELYRKNYYAIGFKNDADSYELRNEKFKAGGSSKGITLIKNGAIKLTVFEVFFNFLSYQAIHQKQEQPNTIFLILNSTSFFKKNCL